MRSWLDADDPLALALFGDDMDPGAVAGYLQEASDFLAPLAGFLVHRGGRAVEQFTPADRALSLPLTWQPVDTVESIAATWDGDLESLVEFTHWVYWQGSIRFTLAERDARGGYVRWGDVRRTLGACTPSGVLEVSYTFRPTLTIQDKRLCAWLAYQTYLRDNPADGDCQLPESITSVSREGLSMTLLNPMHSMRAGGSETRTGIPRVDTWMLVTNPSRARRLSSVYTPDRPPGVGAPRAVLSPPDEDLEPRR